MLDLTREELQIVLSVLIQRYALLNSGEMSHKADLRSAMEKIAAMVGYEEGVVNAQIVKIQMKKGRIRQ